MDIIEKVDIYLSTIDPEHYDRADQLLFEMRFELSNLRRLFIEAVKFHSGSECPSLSSDVISGPYLVESMSLDFGDTYFSLADYHHARDEFIDVYTGFSLPVIRWKRIE